MRLPICTLTLASVKAISTSCLVVNVLRLIELDRRDVRYHQNALENEHGDGGRDRWPVTRQMRGCFEKPMDWRQDRMLLKESNSQNTYTMIQNHLDSTRLNVKMRGNSSRPLCMVAHERNVMGPGETTIQVPKTQKEGTVIPQHKHEDVIFQVVSSRGGNPTVKSTSKISGLQAQNHDTITFDDNLPCLSCHV